MSKLNSLLKTDNNIMKNNGDNNKSKVQPISDELRDLVINSIESGTCNRKAAAKLFNISYATVLQICRNPPPVGVINAVENVSEQSNGINEEKIATLKRKFFEKYIGLENEQKELQMKSMKLNGSVKSQESVRGNGVSAEIKNLLQSSDNTITEENSIAVKKSLDIDLTGEKYESFVQRNLEKYNQYQTNPPKMESEITVKPKFILPSMKNSDMTNTKVLLPSKAQEIRIFQYNLHRMPKVILPALTVEQIRERKLYCQNFLSLAKSDRLVVYIGDTNFQATMDFTNNEISNGQRFRTKIPSKQKRIVSSMTNSELLCYRVIDSSRVKFDVLEYLSDLYLELSTRGATGAVLVVDRDLVKQCPILRDSIYTAGHLLLVLAAHCPFLSALEGVFCQLATQVATVTWINMSDMEAWLTGFPKTLEGSVCASYCQRALDAIRGCLIDDLVFDG